MMTKSLPNTQDLETPRQLYQSFRNLAKREQKKNNLDILWNTLEEINKEGNPNFSLAEIGRRMELAGGLKTQSLRNSNGNEFRQLIECYTNSFDESQSISKLNTDPIEYALGLISDPGAQAALRAYVRNAKRLREENINIRAAIKNISLPAETPGTPSKPNIHTDSIPQLLYQSLSLEYIQSLIVGLDRRKIEEWGYVNEDGSVCDLQNFPVFPANFIPACHALLELLSKACPQL